MATRVGTIFAEVGLDYEPYTRAQKRLLKDATSTTRNIEKNFKDLGIKSSQEFDLMRAKITNSYNMIKNSAKASAEDILRAEKAKNEQLKRLDTQQFGHQKSLIESAKKNWLAYTAAVTAAYFAIKKVVDLTSGVVMAAARYETLGVVMQNVGRIAGYSSSQMNEFAKGLEKTGISMTGARESLTKMAQAQLDLNESSKLARIAQDAAVIGNINSTEAFNQLVYGIQSANVRVLRTIGINVDFENSYKKLETQLGKTKDEFTEAEKAQARLNVVLEAGTRIQGSYEAAMDTAGKKMLSLERHWQNLQVLMGQVFTPALAEAVDAITTAIVGVNAGLEDSESAIAQWAEKFRSAIAWIIQDMKDLVKVYNFINDLAGKELTDKDMRNVEQMMGILSPPAGGKIGSKTPGWDIYKPVGGTGGAPVIPPPETPESADMLAAVEKYQFEFQQAMAAVTPLEATLLGGAQDQAAIEEALKLMDIFETAKLDSNSRIEEAVRNSDNTLRDMELSKRALEMELLKGSSDYKMALLQEQHDLALLLIKEEQDAEIKKAATTKRVTADMVDNSIAALRLFGEQDEAAFNAWKVAASAKVAVSAASAAMKSYDALSDIPYVGPALGAAAAAAAILYGSGQISSIMGQQYSSPGTTRNAGSGAGTGTYPVSPATGQPEIKDGERQGTTVNIYVDGNVIDQTGFAREMVEYIQKATEDGAH